MAEYVSQTPEKDAEAEQAESVLELQRLDDEHPEVEVHFASPLCLEV